MLLAAPGAKGPESSVESPELSIQQLTPIVDAAIERLIDAGLPSGSFSNVEVTIDDLPGATLGLARGNSVTIDIDGAGHGWFIDATPLDDSEFDSSSQLATLDSQHRIDLLTVIIHELGHTADLPDLNDAAQMEDLMYHWIEAGQRKTSLEMSLTDRAFAEL